MPGGLIEVSWHASCRPGLDEVGPVSEHELAEDAVRAREARRRERSETVDERRAERVRQVLAM